MDITQHALYQWLPILARADKICSGNTQAVLAMCSAVDVVLPFVDVITLIKSWQQAYLLLLWYCKLPSPWFTVNVVKFLPFLRVHEGYKGVQGRNEIKNIHSWLSSCATTRHEWLHKMKAPTKSHWLPLGRRCLLERFLWLGAATKVMTYHHKP